MNRWQRCIQRVLSRFEMSEGELAQCLKTSPRTVDRWLRGETEPAGLHADVLNALSAASKLPQPKERRSIIQLGVGSMVYTACGGRTR